MASKLKSSLKNKWIYLVAILFTWVVVVIHSFVYDTWITGGGSILAGDPGMQYVQMFYELWDKVHGKESLFYSWHTLGGVDFYVNAAYYLCSPFTLIVLALPRTWISNTVQFVMVLKWSLASATMVYFFLHTRHNTLREHKKLIALFLGIAWGLSNAMIGTMTYMNWMDAMILFPVLLILIEKMVQNKTWKLYYILLTLCMLCNFYITYHIGLFLLLWFGMQLENNTKEKFKKFLIFIGSSVLAVISGMVVILPSLVAEPFRHIQSGNEAVGNFANSVLNSIYDVVESLFIFDSLSASLDQCPNLYFSVIGVLLAFLFLFIKIDKKKKGYIIAVTLFMTASLFFGFLNLIWHGFAIPHGAYNRFVNAYTFFLLFLALQVLIHLEEIHLRHIIITGIIGLASIIITFLGLDSYQGFHVYLATILLFVLYIVILVYYNKKSITYSGVLTIFAVFGILEMTVNGFFAISPYDDKLFLNDEGGRQITELTEDLNVSDGERIAYQASYCNWGMVAGQASGTGFLSYCNGNYINFNKMLGLNYSDALIFYNSGSPLLNLMFNVRYAVGESGAIVSDAIEIEEQDGYCLYKTQHLAGLGYMVNNKLEQWDISDEMPFALQNSFVKYAVDEEDIFTIVKTNPVCASAITNLEPDAELAKQGIYLCSYTAQFGDANDCCQMEFVVEEDMDLYMVTRKSRIMNDYLLIDGEEVDMIGGEVRQSMLHIGNVKKGQTVTYLAFPSTPISPGTDVLVQCQFAQFNGEQYADAYSKLSENIYQIDTMKADYIKGTIRVEKDGLMMTSIQAQDGFTVLVDGVETEYKVIGGCMIGIPLISGDHTIEFIYRTPYLTGGLLLSLLGILIFIGVSACGRYGNKSDQAEE